MKNTICLWMFIACFSGGILAQNEKKPAYPSLSFTSGKGAIIPTTDFVRGDNQFGKPIDRYGFVCVKLLWQNPGYRDWQRRYHGPYYGAGTTLNLFQDREEIGMPVSAFGILGIPLKRWQKAELYTEFQFGIASNWKKYDIFRNPNNKAIGGRLTVHLDIGFNAFYPLGRHLDLGAGLRFIHFSNGGMERPNRGFNICSPSLELKYHPAGRPSLRQLDPPDKQRSKNGLFIMLGYGNQQLVEHEFDTNYFAVAGLSALFTRKFTGGFRLGAGTDLNYWMGLTARTDGTMGTRNFENLTVGMILQPEMIVGRMTLTGGVGIYALHRNYGDFRQLYQRLGVRYDLYRKVSLGVNIRAIHFMLAEFLEFNLGYRL